MNLLSLPVLLSPIILIDGFVRRSAVVFFYLVGLRNADVEHPVGDERKIVDSSVGADDFDRVEIGLVGAVGHHADVGAQGSVQRESTLDSLDLATGSHRFFVNLSKQINDKQKRI